MRGAVLQWEIGLARMILSEQGAFYGQYVKDNSHNGGSIFSPAHFLRPSQRPRKRPSRFSVPLNILGGGSFRWPGTRSLDRSTRDTIVSVELA
jgi:hypothetical protein